MGLKNETKGLVLHSMPVGEYDKRLILLTKEYGKITAFAKGAKRPSSKYLAGSEVFAYGEYGLYKGKNSYSVNSFMLIDNFRNLTTDIEILAYGLYVLEVVEFVSVENQGNIEVMELALRSLKALEKRLVSSPLILEIFRIRLLKYLGLMPDVSQCSHCGKKDEEVFYIMNDSGVMCDSCLNGHQGLLELHSSTSKIIQYIMTVELKKLYKFSVEEIIFIEIKRFTEDYFKAQIGKQFKSLDLLKDIF